jgi:hypothetical protein
MPHRGRNAAKTAQFDNCLAENGKSGGLAQPLIVPFILEVLVHLSGVSIEDFSQPVARSFDVAGAATVVGNWQARKLEIGEKTAFGHDPVS